MKKILEVLEYSDTEIRFNTDLALSNNREELLVNLDLTSEAHGVAFRETIDIMVNAGKAVKIAPGASASPNLS